MTDFQELMQILSIPRPDGSRAEMETRLRMQAWLSRHKIPYRVHPFTYDPYFFEAIGVWLIVSRSLLAAAIWLRWGWAATAIALAGLPGGLADVAFHVHLVSWPGRRRGENLLVELDPHGENLQPTQEVILSAHYDSKTEPLDHRERMVFLKQIRFGIGLTVLLAAWGPVDRYLWQSGSPGAGIVHTLGVALALYLLLVAWGLGLNLTLGRLLPQSQGAVDNGASCAILLGLAEQLSAQKLTLKRTRVTIALFSGEEANFQGSRAYARERAYPLPAVNVNLEVMAQDGDYVFWELDGSAFDLRPADPGLSQAIAQSVLAVTGRPARPAGPVLSDGGSFIFFTQIPTAILGTYDRRLQDRGFHHPTDNLERVQMDRLPEGVDILAHFLQRCDREGLRF